MCRSGGAAWQQTRAYGEAQVEPQAKGPITMTEVLNQE